MKGHRFIISGIFLASVVGANAGVYTFTAPSHGLNDLDHAKAYSWGMNVTLAPAETLSGATLTFYGIYDWQREPNVLNLTLLNTPSAYKAGRSGSLGTSSNFINTKTDYEATGSYWETTPGAYGGWTHLTSWTDYDGTRTSNKLVYDFQNLYIYNNSGTTLLQTITGTSKLGTLGSYIADDGLFGIGLDPDCHYYDCGVELKLTTTEPGPSVPGPMAIIPFGVGLVAAYMRRRR
jgi:hypothetical protein